MRSFPVLIDLFSLIIFLGVVQGVVLGVFFLTGKRGRTVSNRCLGWFLLSLSAISSEICLNYTNYMFRTLALVDFSEPFNFLPGPLYYLFIQSRLNKRLPRHWGWHLLPFVVWVLNSVTWLYQPIEFKYNSYIYSHYPELPYVSSEPYLEEDFTGGLRDYVSEITLLSFLVYTILGLIAIRKAYVRESLPIFGATPRRLAVLRNLTMYFLLVPILIVVVKPQFYHDLGDYILACYITISIYATSLAVMSGSDFFQEEPEPAAEPAAEPRRKYEKSSLSEEVEASLLPKLIRLMDEEKPYLESDVSLAKLAQRLSVSPHHLSQVLNDRLNQNFFDLLATYRVREAQQLLQDPATANLKIDEIAERVGYNSTSAFHTAFKRLTGRTPAQFRAGNPAPDSPDSSDIPSSRSA